MDYEVVKIFGFTIYNDSLDKIILDRKILNTISPNSYGISTKDLTFKKALLNSDYLVLDGVFFSLASIFLLGKNIVRNQGPDVFNFLMNKINLKHGKVFFLGSSLETLDIITKKAKYEYPNISVGTYSPPFKDEFSENDNEEIISNVNHFSPDVLFVGMTCPKQEKWVYKNAARLNIPLICSIGAVFDWYAGNQKNIHPLWWKFRLGWLKRTIDRPEILKRYPIIGIFFRDLLLAILRVKKF